MRIALISTPFVAVPPPQYGGTELIVHELVEGLSAQGHAVTLFACGGSRASGPNVEVRALYDCARWPPDPYPELDHAAWAVEQLLADPERFDLVHAHVPSALPFASFLDVPMVYTVHHERDPRLSPLYARSRAHMIAISARQRELAPELARASVIHHGVSPDRYALGRGAGGYAAFLGRFAREKGVHHAIDAARAADLPIRLAGKPHPTDGEYFEKRVAPRLARAGVTHIGEVGGESKTAFLRDARALLFPIDWEEPFGLVMVEAMLCGTPVLAFGRGSAPEVVEEGITGFICEDVVDLTCRLRSGLDGFDRERCRRRALERWTAARMVAEHLRLYESITTTSTWDEVDARGRATATAPAA
jgi:glycosyltransferase involved in cell wall biosynthesis